MTPLRDYLLDAYGHADRRFKDRNVDHPIQVDDRDAGDVHSHFCSLFVSVPDRSGDALILTLHCCPTSPEVLELVETLGGSVRPDDVRPTIILSLKISESPAIRRLARAIKSIVGRGRSYEDTNLRWICPRTAASLVKLAQHLARYRAESRTARAPTAPTPSRRLPPHVMPKPPVGTTDSASGDLPSGRG